MLIKISFLTGAGVRRLLVLTGQCGAGQEKIKHRFGSRRKRAGAPASGPRTSGCQDAGGRRRKQPDQRRSFWMIQSKAHGGHPHPLKTTKSTKPHSANGQQGSGHRCPNPVSRVKPNHFPTGAGLAIWRSRSFSSCMRTGLFTTTSTEADKAPPSLVVFPAPVIRMTGVSEDSTLIIWATA